MAKKYDTNPLDPDFPEKVREQETVILPKSNGETRKFAEVDERENPTRRYEQGNFASHANAYNTTQPVEKYRVSELQKEDITRKVAKVGLPENVLTALPYLPFHIGLVAGFVELFIIPKSETKVRFHAAQGLAAQLGIMIITMIFGFVHNFTEFARIGNWIFYLVSTILLIIWSLKAYQGKPVHIESVDDLTNWLEDKIQPQK